MTHPNNGLNSYAQQLHDEYGLKEYRLIPKVIQVMPIILWRTLKDAGIEILFLVVFGYIIISMSQGRDLVVSLFEPDGLYGNSRIIFTTLAVISFSVSMWVIPAALFQYRENKRRDTDERLRKNYESKNPEQIHLPTESPFKTHLFFMHRVLPLAPFWLLAAALFNDDYWIFITAALLQLALLYVFNREVNHDRTRRIMMIVIGAILGISTTYFFINFQKQYTSMKVVLALNLYLLSALMFLIFHEVDNNILKEHRKGMAPGESLFRKYPLNSGFYLACLLIHTVIVLLIYYMPFRLGLAPESMLLYMFSVYVFAIDLVFYIISISRKWQLIGGVTAAIMFGLLLSPWWNINTSHHTMDRNKDQTYLKGRNRDNFEDRYRELRGKIIRNQTGDPYPIILVSGEGGGSRAGLWFSQNLINFDYETRGKFRNHIFSVSTVSGSSVGLSTIFSFWDKTRDSEVIDSSWLKLPEEIYSNNYIGSSIRGLLLTDFYKSVIPGRWSNDRNNTLQNEEATTTARAILKVQGDERYKAHNLPDSLLTLKKDLMYYFYDNRFGDIRYRRNTPITLINTTRSNDGRRGIFSSIRLSDRYFNDAIDVAGYLYEDMICTDDDVLQCRGLNKPISLGQACNTSELFPLFSAPVYIDSLGSFVDGGYHENSGLKSTLDIYHQLSYRLSKDSLDGQYKIYIMYLKNGSGEKKLYKKMNSELTILQPLNALFNQPFAGSASYFEERAKFISTSDPDAVFLNVNLKPNYIVDASKPGVKGENLQRDLEPEMLRDMINEVVTRSDGKKDTILNFPLARWLSRTVINRILVNASPINRKPDVEELLNLVRSVNGVRPTSKKPFEKYPSVPELRVEDDSLFQKRMMHRKRSVYN